MFTFFEVVNFQYWVYGIVFDAYFYLSFDVSLPIIIIELLLLFKIIRKLINFDLPLWVFI